MTEPTRPLLYRVRRVEGPATVRAPWAITVQCVGEDDSEARILAYARAEHIAERICLALRQSDRLAREDNARAASAYATEISDAWGSLDDE